MSMRDAIGKMQEAYAELIDESSVTDVRAFLLEHGMPADQDLSLQTCLLGTIVGDLVERGVDPSALGAAMAVLGAQCEQAIAIAKEHGDG